MNNKSKIKGFTLIELLVVVAIVGLLASIILASLNSSRSKAQDAKRLSSMHQIQIALELYFSNNGQYPGNTDNDCWGWDTGYYNSGDTFILPLESGGAISKVPGDPNINVQCGGYRYYRYGAGDYGCDSSRGAYYVLGVSDMETSGNPYSSSPGWSCSGRNWQGEFDWVTGKFEQ